MGREERKRGEEERGEREERKRGEKERREREEDEVERRERRWGNWNGKGDGSKWLVIWE